MTEICPARRLAIPRVDISTFVLMTEFHTGASARLLVRLQAILSQAAVIVWGVD